MKKALTLVELLVVVSIITLISSVAYASFSDARKDARDAKRIVETRNMATALEAYHVNRNYYPSPETDNFDDDSGTNASDASGYYRTGDAGYNDIMNELISEDIISTAPETTDDFPYKYLCIDDDTNGTCDEGYFIPTVEKGSNANKCRIEGVGGHLSEVMCSNKDVEIYADCQNFPYSGNSINNNEYYELSASTDSHILWLADYMDDIKEYYFLNLRDAPLQPGFSVPEGMFVYYNTEDVDVNYSQCEVYEVFVGFIVPHTKPDSDFDIGSCPRVSESAELIIKLANSNINISSNIDNYRSESCPSVSWGEWGRGHTWKTF